LTEIGRPTENGILYANYRGKEENFLLVDKRKIAKAKFYIQNRHDKVLTGSFLYSTRQNCNRVKTSIALQNLHRIDVIEPWLQLFPPVVRQQQRARELNIVNNYTTHTTILRQEKNFLVRKKKDSFYITHTTSSDWQLSVLHTTKLESREDFYRSAELTYNKYNRVHTLM